jgi:hypothetical protein
MTLHPPLLLAVSEERAINLGLLVPYLLLVFLTLWIARSVEIRLIVVGLLTGVLAAVWGQFPGVEGVTVQPPRSAPGGGLSWTLGGGGAEPLGRIAVLLVLGGLAVCLLGRWNNPQRPTTREEATHDKPV